MTTGTQEGRTYYDLLEIPINASTEEVKKAYIRIAKKLHPDTQIDGETEFLEDESEDLSKTRAFKMITFAYHTLKDPKLRAEYDEVIQVRHLRDWSETFRDEIGDKYRELYEAKLEKQQAELAERNKKKPNFFSQLWSKITKRKG